MSLSKFFILSVLAKRPMHGYEIAREVARISNGCCSPSEGTIYPVLKQYQSGGYVDLREENFGGRLRKVYSLTPKGRDAFKVAVDAWMEVTEGLEACRQLSLEGSASYPLLRD
ncbi:PadR family transcriptional regulator [Salipiger mucosus]|nr:PadR family transcriptional regulator [Salipiger mucosus]